MRFVVLALFAAAALGMTEAAHSDSLRGNARLNFESPADPPFFNWPAQPDTTTYRFEMSRDESFSAGKTLQAVVTRNFFMPAKVMGDGRWFYRIKPDRGEWSDIYAVTIADDATRFVVPKRIGFLDAHPRLYIQPDDIAAMRQDAKGAKGDLWLKAREKADAALGAALVSEPPRFKWNPDGSLDIDGWRRVVNAGGKVGSDIIHLSFAYLISEDPAYLSEARRVIGHVSSWAIPGSTADPSHVDHPARDILHALCMAYDWLYHDLSPEERARLRGVIVARAEGLYEFENPFYGLGANNHPWLRMAALADAGCVLLGDHPKAEDWLDFAQGLYAGRFWCLGGKNGDWHEGISYWSYALLFALEFADVVKSATGVDFYQHPWARQLPNFPIYASPPGSSGLPYGDVRPGPPDSVAVLAMMRLARATRNPYAKWYADRTYIVGQFPMQHFLAMDPSLPSRPPVDLPQSILFEGPGWSVFHSSLEGRDNVFFTMRAGRFYASGHEHPDQNSFAIEAFGKRLVIDSGYYDWYGSQHHYGWVLMTKAHNVIMVDGKGQAGMRENPNKECHGKTAEFFRSPVANYAIGDASNPRIYNGAVRRFLRMAAFLAPDVIAIYDIIETPKPSRIDWLLHTTADPVVSADSRSFDMEYEGVGLRFDMLKPDAVTLSKTIGYDPIPPEKKHPQDAHLTFSLPNQTTDARFLTVYRPYKPELGRPKQDAGSIEGRGAIALRIGADQVLFRCDSDAPSVSAGGLATDGWMASAGAGKWSLCSGTRLVVGGKTVLSASAPVSAACGGSEVYFSADGPRSISLRLATPPPASIPPGWKFHHKSGLLRGSIPAGESTVRL